MSGAGGSDVGNVPSPISSSSSTSHNSSNVDDVSEPQQLDSKSKLKRSKSEASKALLEKMVKLQENSDKMMFMLEEKRANMEERQIELDAQLRREERDFQLQIMQMMMRQNVPHHPPPVPPYHSSFDYGNMEFDPDATQDGL